MAPERDDRQTNQGDSGGSPDLMLDAEELELLEQVWDQMAREGTNSGPQTEKFCMEGENKGKPGPCPEG